MAVVTFDDGILYDRRVKMDGAAGWNRSPAAVAVFWDFGRFVAQLTAHNAHVGRCHGMIFLQFLRGYTLHGMHVVLHRTR